MKRCALSIAIALFLAVRCLAQPSPRSHDNFDFDWQFFRGDAPGAQNVDFDSSSWRKLDLPHDWSIEGTWDPSNPTGGAGGFFPAGIGWYRKAFAVPAAASGKKVMIEFDGAFMNTEVWINGEYLGKWPYGYSSFAYDLTPHIRFGQPNVIAVKCDASKQPASRYYTGGGIFRNVWLTITDPLRVAHWGTYVTTPKVNEQAATVKLRTSIQNDRQGAADITLTSQIVDKDGKLIASQDVNKSVAAGSAQDIDQTIEVPNPHLWSIESPSLYTLHSVVKVDGQVVDDYPTPIGIRQIEYDLNKGFLLNGKQVKMQGVCLHHEAGAVGSAVPEGVWERRLNVLKEMGCNAIRTAHNPFDPVFLDLCDRMGFVVMDEAFDEWTIAKPQVRGDSYSKFFNEWYEKDVTNFVRRDRNHPSVVMWSAGNEIGEQRARNGDQVLKKLVDVFHREDPSRPVTAGMDNIYTDQGSAPEAFTGLLDIVGYNYVDRWLNRRETIYADDRAAHPNWRFVGTESNGVGGSRNAYSLPPLPGPEPEGPIVSPTTLPVPQMAARGGARGQRGAAAPATRGGAAGARAGGGGFAGARGGNYATGQVRGEALWKFIKTHDYVIGDFMWTGIDYLGETSGNSRGAGSGRIDICGFPKDGFYFYQSQWTNKPMIHLMPHWNWPQERVGQIIPVVAYTNCDTVELFVNGKSYGRKTLEFPRVGSAGGWNTPAYPGVPAGSTLDLHLTWDVAYAPGTLRAVGYKLGQVMCEEIVKTSGEPAQLKVDVDHPTLKADARDVAHFTVKVLDSNGLLVPTANPMLSFDLQGPAKIIGTDNGNLQDTSSNISKDRAAFNGMALAIIQTTKQSGKIRMTVKAEGLKEATVEIDSR
jgi:beta-galactosidase